MHPDLSLVSFDPDVIMPVGYILDPATAHLLSLGPEWAPCEGQDLADYPDLDAVFRPHGWTTVPDFRMHGAYWIKTRLASAPEGPAQRQPGPGASE